MGERIKATVPVFVFLTREDSVYLQRRANTGYLDGYYDTPSGKTDKGESIQDAVCREAAEETGIELNSADLELFHTYLNNNNPNHPWLGLMFRTDKWRGEPFIAEPDKCDHAAFFPLDLLPDNITPQVKDGLARLATASSIEVSYYPEGSVPTE